MSGAGEARREAVRAAGFTLLEMLVILSILGLIGGIAFPALERQVRWQAFMGAAGRLEVTLHAARAAAIREQRPTSVRTTPDRRAIGFGRPEPLPEGVAVTLPAGGIGFFADGSASGGDVALAGAGRERRWRIRPATGAIERVP